MWHLSHLRHACVLDIQNHTHTAVHIYTQSVGRAALVSGIMLLKNQLSGEKLQTEREETLSGMSARQQGGGKLRERELHVDSVARGRRQHKKE